MLDQAASGFLDRVGDRAERAAEERFGGAVVEALPGTDEPPVVAELGFERARDPGEPGRHRPGGNLPARLGKPLAEHCRDVDARGLLGALAARAYRELCERLEAVPLTGRDTRERVTALSVEYVAFAEENRALFDLMWRTSQFDVDDPELAEQKRRALRALDRALRGPGAQLPDGADPALLPSYTVWSLAHGYATLALEGAIDYDGADPATSGLLPAMLRLLDIRPNGDN